MTIGVIVSKENARDKQTQTDFYKVLFSTQLSKHAWKTRFKRIFKDLADWGNAVADRLKELRALSMAVTTVECHAVENRRHEKYEMCDAL